MTHLKDASPLLVFDFSVVAHHKCLEVCARLWLREIPNDLCGEKAFLQLYIRQEGELLQAANMAAKKTAGRLTLCQPGQKAVLRGGKDDMGPLRLFSDLHGAKVLEACAHNSRSNAATSKSSYLDKEPQQSLEISLQCSVTFIPLHQHISLINADDRRRPRGCTPCLQQSLKCTNQTVYDR